MSAFKNPPPDEGSAGSGLPPDHPPAVTPNGTDVRVVQAILDTVVDGIVSIDERGTILSANRATESVFGYTTDELLGQNVTILMPSPYREEHDGYLANYLRTRVKKVIGIGREVVGQRKDGSTFPLDLAIGETVLDGKSIFTGIMRDISERKRLEARVLRGQRLESIGTLAGGIAHDLNNVLTPISVASQLLALNRPGADTKALVQMIQTSSARGAEMIKQLLAFAGGGPSQRVSVDMIKLLRELRGLLDHTLPKSVEIQVSVAPDLWTVMGDITELTQVLMNLCVNARDAMLDGGHLRISARNVMIDQRGDLILQGAQPGPYVLLSVEDSGCGIPPELVERIFDPFFTTKEQGKGTGLGLSTTVGIVRGHGGLINVYSEPGRGTRFVIHFPAVDQAESDRSRETADPFEAGHGELLLLVDDEILILQATQMALEALGYRVITAGGGQQGAEMYEQRQSEINAVIIDMMMPGMDGPATIRAIRAINPTVPILAGSGLQTTAKMSEAKAAGANDFLQKPYSTEDLLSKLREVMTG